MKRLETDGLTIRGTLRPTPKKQAAPLERQRADGSLVGCARVALLLGIDLCPEGMSRGFCRPCHACGAEERRTLKAPVDPGLLAAACGHRRAAGLLLECLGRGRAFALGTKGDEEAGGKDGPGAWQRLTQRKVGGLLGAWGDDVSEICQRLPGDAEWGHERWPQEGRGGDDAVIGGPGKGALDGLEAGRADLGRAPMVGPAEARKRRAARQLGGFARRPVAEDVTKEHGIFLGQPGQNVRQGVCEGTGQPVGPPHWVADQATAGCDELGEGTPGGALGLQGCERVAVCEEQCDLACRLGGVVFGPAGGQCVAVRGPSQRMDRKAPEALLLTQGRHEGALMECEAHRDGLPRTSRAQAVAPRVDRVGTVCEHDKLPRCCPGGW
jgi:hypothetical protein